MTEDTHASDSGEAPRQLGPYVLIRQLGRGGQGQVFVAEDTRLRRRVALKILGLVYDSRFIERFRREATAASRLDHPSICTVFEAGELGGTHFIAMKLVEGESLEARIDRWRRDGLARSGSGSEEAARIQQVVDIVERTSRALHVAHEAGLVHRDVKPGNIMIDESGVPVLLDFGLARDDRPGEAGLTLSGEMMGTPDYMPPEQLLGQGARVDRRSDVYALGATLYEALTLRRPFEAPTRERLFQEILSSEPADPTRSSRHIGRDLKTVLETALQKDPDRRYDSALALADELACVRSLRPIRARPVSRVARAARWARRNPVVAGALAMLLIVLGAGLSTALVLLGRLRAEKAATDDALLQARATALVRASEQAADEDPMLALLLAREAMRARPSAASRSRLHEALHGSLERSVLRGHEDALGGATFVPGSGDVLTWSQDGTLRLWRGKREIARLAGEGGVTAAACLPDGSLIAAGFEDGSVRILDRELGAVASPEGHRGAVRSVDFSPDGRSLLTAADDETARLWSVTGERLADLRGHERAIWAARFSSDGMRIVTASLDGTARVWTRRGEPLGICRGHAGPLTGAAFAPAGDEVLTASFDGTARIWSPDGRQLAELRGHAGIVASARFLGRGDTILTTSFDGTARIWDRAGTPIAVLRGHRGRILAADACPTAGLLLTASADGTARTWSLDGRPRDVLRGHAGAVQSASFAATGDLVVTASTDGTARLWAARRSELATFSAGAPIRCAEMSPAGDAVLTGSTDGSIRVWNRDGTCRVRLDAHRGAIHAVRFAPTAPLFASASEDGIARLWTLDGCLVATLSGHGSGVLDAAFSPASDVVATCSADRAACLWLPSGRQVAALQGQAVVGVRFSPDGRRLLTWSLDATAAVWDTSGQLVARLAGHAGPVRSAAFSPEGALVITGSADRTARLWDLSGRARAEFRGHLGPVRSVCIATGPGLCATASGDGTARLWNLEGREIAVLRHGGEVFSAAFSPDGILLVTASADGTARLWDEAGTELASLRGHDGTVLSAGFSPDGRVVQTVGGDGRVEHWLVRSEDLLELAAQRITRDLSVTERQAYSEFLGR